MKKSIPLILIVFLSCEVSIYADPIYQQSMDASWLMANAAFQSRTPTLVNDGSAIDFRASGVNNRDYDILLEVPLAAGEMLPYGSKITIEISAIPLSSDNDLEIGITDGANVITFARSDNSGGHGTFLEGEYFLPMLL